ncbi:MAG: DivIVA domain-containing protein [Chlorobiales bacterium]|jgi:DivIVA domain-containing protein|nr:DivIVA domain-containing protein [Chlorobiales bacterium]
MKLTPLDIKKQEFKRVLRGYDPADVDAFLETLSKHWEELLDQNETQKRRAQELEMEIQKFRQVENMLHQTLAQAQQSSSAAIENAKREAELIKQEAQIKASRLMEQAQSQVGAVKGDIHRLQVQRHDILSKLQHLLSAQLELVNSYDKKDVFYSTSGEHVQWQETDQPRQVEGKESYAAISQPQVIKPEVLEDLSGKEAETDIYFRPITPPASGEKPSTGAPFGAQASIAQKKSEVNQLSVSDTVVVKPLPQQATKSNEENSAPEVNIAPKTTRVEVSIDNYKSTANNKINIDDILDSLE